MKKILGLDLGTASIGWALVNEAETTEETSEIIKLGVRVIQYENFNKVDSSGKVSESKNPIDDFKGGKGLSPNAKRTLQRGARRNLQRFKQRRKNLIELMLKNKLIDKTTLLTEIGKNSTHKTLEIRAKSAKEKIEKEDFARVLLAINKKRGYKSSRKAKNEEEGNLIDGMSVAKELYDNDLTVGQYVYQLLEKGAKYIPDFYRSDLQFEFDKVWNEQKKYYPEILTDQLYDKLKGKNKGATFKICEKPFDIEGSVKQTGTTTEKKKEKYLWRSEAISKEFDLEHLVVILQEVNNDLNKSSGYLGAISDRSKELYFNKETVGENLYKQIQNNPNKSLKSQVFYRQDYLDEFEQIWETQSKYYSELTDKLKEEIRDVVIFYQRKLKSQKHLISNCEFEKFHKVIPKSSPLFQEFKIWLILNNLKFTNKKTKEEFSLDEDSKNLLFDELNLRGNFTVDTIFKFLGTVNKKEWSINYKEGIEGNRTNEALYNIYQKIAEKAGYGFDWSKNNAAEIKNELKQVFQELGVNQEILDFNSDISGHDFDKQESYQLWHLLYSAEEDEDLKKKLQSKFGFNSDSAKMLANISFQQDYGNLSARAIKNILPHLKAGHDYSEACCLAGYNHSNSLTKEELQNRVLNDTINILKKNSLRNPVVEKILNQMVNLVNQVIETYGKPDEIRIELARELKKSAKERAEMTLNLNSAKNQYESFRKLLQKEFGIINPTRNDIIRYRLYEELKTNGYKSLYTDTYIPREKLFSKEIDIEHIIPKTKLFDDSFSNKTLAYRKPNQDKGSLTAIDYIDTFNKVDSGKYRARIELLYNKGKGVITKAKYLKLLMKNEDIPDGFIERDLRNSQFIAKKAKQLLEEVVRKVNTTTGSVTGKLREDWNLINVMQELNLEKYKAIDKTLIEQVEKKDGTFKIRIKDWNKRNDHRHHAMDALTVAFTKYNHVQYFNFLNARKDETHHEHKNIVGIENKETYKDKNGRRKFIKPMPNFREEAKKHIESILISFKTKNKVVTNNINKTRRGGKYFEKIQLTPRGQLHKETVYGKISQPIIKEEKVNGSFNLEKIQQVTKPHFKKLLLKRLQENEDNPKKAFTGKNTLAKNPIFIDDNNSETLPDKVKLKYFEDNFTIRKEVSPELKIEKVIDTGIREKLNERLKSFGGNAKEAFSDLEKNPIWLNKDKGISIKRVKISGVKNAESLHIKKNHLGEELKIKEETIPNDFVNTGNNHHVAIYKDEKGKLQENVISFYEAVARVNSDLSIVNKEFNKEKGWEFLFTLKQNEMFVFPAKDFDPNEYDLLDAKNTTLISKYLYRVQSISVKDYWFRHHLETKVENKTDLNDFAYKRKRNPESIKDIIKVRINHLGNIVHVGEY